MTRARLRPGLLGLLALVIISAACGQKIGDSCSIASDCSSNNSRVCDAFSRGGYCTIQGCDFNTCPQEAVCIRFFPTVVGRSSCTDQTQCFASEACTNAGLCVPADSACENQGECATDEFCTIAGACAPRSIEQRFCMLACSSNDDCREGYECRTLALMKQHGGEPVPDPNASTAQVPDKPFCAPLRPCSQDPNCDSGEHCGDLGVCVKN
jgi:hypothetical protein